MNKIRKIEIFSAGCSICDEAISLVNRLACPSCEISVLDIKQTDISNKAKSLGVRSVPALVIDGRLADCCGQGLKEENLRRAGLGMPLL